MLTESVYLYCKSLGDFEERQWVMVDSCNSSRVTLALLGAVVLLLGGVSAFGADSTGLVPLTELAAGAYKGFEGGLYPGGSNDIPAGHLALGRMRVGEVVPRDAGGNPDPNGWIVMISIGMSDTCHESGAYERVADIDPYRNGRLVIINGSQGGKAAEDMDDYDAPYWPMIDKRLAGNNLTAKQVQVAWMKQANRRPENNFPIHAQGLTENMRRIAGIMHDRYPNLKLLYLSSRIYAGYATGNLNPEPQAYEGGFSVKWLIEDQINGDADLNNDPNRGAVTAPWLGWGPYLWADGLTPRSDGLIWERANLEGDGTHPPASGEWKVAGLMSDFFGTAATTGWCGDKAGTALAYADAKADAHVSQDQPDKNFGSAARLEIAAGKKNVYLRFDVSGVNRPVLRAKLSMRVVQDGPTAQLSVVDNSSWDEAAITWNNAPAAGASFISTGSVSRDGTISGNVTEQVNADVDGIVTFVLQAKNGSGTYHSIEAGQAPRLILTLAASGGDITGNGIVDYQDVGRVAGRWLWTGPPGDAAEDIAKDGRVNFVDFGKCARNWTNFSN